MRKQGYCLLALALASGCPEGKRTPAQRAGIRRLTGSTLEFVPTEGQLPYCLILTTSSKGVVRQLTMTRENKSIRCEGARPIGGVSYRVPIDEGPIKAFIFFSDRRLNAGSVAEQLVEMTARPNFNTMDLRLPGQVSTEVLEFSPEEGASPTVGGIVGPSGALREGSPDAGGDGPADAGR